MKSHAKKCTSFIVNQICKCQIKAVWVHAQLQSVRLTFDHGHRDLSKIAAVCVIDVRRD